MGHFLLAPSGPGEASALAIILLPLLLPVRLLVASSSATHQLPPTMCYFLFSFLGQCPQQVFSTSNQLWKRTYIRSQSPEKKCCVLLFTELPALKTATPTSVLGRGQGLRQRKEHHKHIHGPIKMHILRKGVFVLKLVT